MTSSLTSFFSPALVRSIAAEFERATPTFATDRFVAAACKGLASKTLLARAWHIADALAQALPANYVEAAAVVEQSLGSPIASDELIGIGMAPFRYLPHGFFAARYGLDHFDQSMRLLHAITQRCSCEWSIRPFIARDPKRARYWLTRWTQDPSPHVRRLVSEGTRMKLPWGTKVDWLNDNPNWVLELLEELKDDAASVVRRSVANNLGDIAKVHPDDALTTCERWYKTGGELRKNLVLHAIRTQIKQGNPRALALCGASLDHKIEAALVKPLPKRARIGDAVTFEVDIRSTVKRAITTVAVVDFAVEFAAARPGNEREKVFKLQRVSLNGTTPARLSASFSLRQMSTRKVYPGAHRLSLVVNGNRTLLGTFTVVA